MTTTNRFFLAWDCALDLQLLYLTPSRRGEESLCPLLLPLFFLIRKKLFSFAPCYALFWTNNCFNDFSAVSQTHFKHVLWRFSIDSASRPKTRLTVFHNCLHIFAESLGHFPKTLNIKHKTTNTNCKTLQISSKRKHCIQNCLSLSKMCFFASKWHTPAHIADVWSWWGR
jgi:hypothetical protein